MVLETLIIQGAVKISLPVLSQDEILFLENFQHFYFLVILEKNFKYTNKLPCFFKNHIGIHFC